MTTRYKKFTTITIAMLIVFLAASLTVGNASVTNRAKATVGFLKSTNTAQTAPRATPEKNTNSDMCQNTKSARVSAVCRELQAHIQRVKDAGENAKKDLPRDSSFGATVEATFKGHMTDNVFILHLPELRLLEVVYILHIPEVVMREQRWVYHTPSVRMETVDVGFGVKMDLPQFFMQEHVTILHVPEITMREQRWVLSVPDITMREQRWVISLPSLTLQDIKAKAGEAKNKVQAAAAGLDQYDRRFKQAIADDMQDQLNKLTEQQATLMAARAAAAGVNADAATLAKMDEGMKTLEAAKAKMQAMIAGVLQGKMPSAE